MGRKDIENRGDIELLVDSFYDKVKKNPLLAPIFSDVARVDWNHHLPHIYSFWSSILLGEQSFTGNPMVKHMQLNQKTPLSEKEFEEWLRLFTQTVDELFAGQKAEEAKMRATGIARIMLYKIQGGR
jgi:hemoglobin